MKKPKNHGHGHRAVILNPGDRFHFLTVIEYAGKKPRVGLLWRCRCDCGKETIVSGGLLRYKHGRMSCGCYQPAHRKGSENTLWRGGRYVADHGYVYVRANHENANKRRYILEHVLVMSQSIGRPLRKGESVHHKNGIRDDNRLENLELCFGAHPHGQRVTDLVEFAKEILMLYEPTALSHFGQCNQPDNRVRQMKP